MKLYLYFAFNYFMWFPQSYILVHLLVINNTRPTLTIKPSRKTQLVAITQFSKWSTNIHFAHKNPCVKAKHYAFHWVFTHFQKSQHDNSVTVGNINKIGCLLKPKNYKYSHLSLQSLYNLQITNGPGFALWALSLTCAYNITDDNSLSL